MKTTINALIFLIGFTYNLKAQSSSQAKQIRSQKDATTKLQELQIKLNLSDQQKDSLYSIFFNQNILADSIKSPGVINNPVKKLQFSSLIKKGNLRIDSLLNPAQKQLYIQWRQERRLSAKKN
ncbi:hypothetical protein SAMN05421820_103442 [Pedobacter steynii]|uniref:LTXXQ motif family protein n=1 Tax=Pedobacter steynii TaxID=430522 RepID=A0A1G9S2I2_9SPHI|nr:hypothetical protein [Pedobacter steynii]NQX37568.1 hypothetical protein [Pedobacter steynii]SDM29624.1 hypothetical protein SAMN05421820_103442 [Pedobacter steynii]